MRHFSLYIIIGLFSIFAVNAQDADLVISDMSISGPRAGQQNIEPFENARFVILLQNCGDTVKERLRVTMEFGENTNLTSGNPNRTIPILQPGDYARLVITVRSPRDRIEIFLTVQDGDETYEGDIVYHLYDIIDTYSEDQLVADCENPLKSLRLKEPVVIAELPDDEPEDDIKEVEKIVRERNPHTGSLVFYSSVSAAMIGVSSYYYISANNNYDLYQNSTHDASSLRDQIETQDLIWKSALAASVPLLIMTTIKAVQFQRAKNSNVQVNAVPVKNGGMVSLTIQF